MLTEHQQYQPIKNRKILTSLFTVKTIAPPCEKNSPAEKNSQCPTESREATSADYSLRGAGHTHYSTRATAAFTQRAVGHK